MSFRPPLVSGVAGGVGATGLSLALHGVDAGIAVPGADIVVCRSNADSLDRAARIADLLDPAVPLPVLAVTVDGAERRTPDRLSAAAPGWSAVVLVPHVSRWRGIVDPHREAAGLLGTPTETLPRQLRPYLDAITRLARAVADSGRLGLPEQRGRSLPAARSGGVPAVAGGGPARSATTAGPRRPGGEGPQAQAGVRGHAAPAAAAAEAGRPGRAAPLEVAGPNARVGVPAAQNGQVAPLVTAPPAPDAGWAAPLETAGPGAQAGRQAARAAVGGSGEPGAQPVIRAEPCFAGFTPFVPATPARPAAPEPPDDTVAHPELRPVRGIRLLAVEPVER